MVSIPYLTYLTTLVVPLHSSCLRKKKKKEIIIGIINTQMSRALPHEKLDRNNFASWEYKMHQYLVGQGYWSYIKGSQENKPHPKDANYSTWEQATS